MEKIVIVRTASGYRFDLRAANGECIAGSEVYSSLALCRKGIASVEKCAPTAGFADLTAGSPKARHPRFELYQDKRGEYRFRLTARNGKVIAASQGYSSRAGCENGIESVRKNARAEDQAQ